jgi:hypothetical protein
MCEVTTEIGRTVVRTLSQLAIRNMRFPDQDRVAGSVTHVSKGDNIQPLSLQDRLAARGLTRFQQWTTGDDDPVTVATPVKIGVLPGGTSRIIPMAGHIIDDSAARDRLNTS